MTGVTLNRHMDKCIHNNLIREASQISRDPCRTTSGPIMIMPYMPYISFLILKTVLHTHTCTHAHITYAHIHARMHIRMHTLTA